MQVTIEEIYEYMHSQLMFNIGIMIGILIAGGLIAFGISCIFLLSGNQDPETLKQHRLLRVYIVVLLFFVTTFIIVEIVRFDAYFIFYVRSSLDQAERLLDLEVFFSVLIAVSVAALTDGLLVWRCYMIQKLALRHNPSRWQNIFWIFPAFLWCLTIVIGLIAASLAFVQSQVHADNLLAAAALFPNIILNTYATLFISIRLLKHKRAMVELAGQKVDVSCYVNIVSILLESAAINVPITIATAVGFGLEAGFGLIMIPIVLSGQALASVIIIHQVAIGRAFSRRHEEELSQLTAERRGSENNDGQLSNAAPLDA